jgi:DNA-binding NarL/FixJ family response regulator
VSTLKPHVLLLGFEDRSDDTLRSIHRLRAAVPGVRIIVVGPLDMPAYHQAALEAGADGFLARTALNDARALLPLLRQAPHTATAANERETVGARLSALTLACL